MTRISGGYDLATDGYAQTSYCFDMESIDPASRMPPGWMGQFNKAQKKGYPVKVRIRYFAGAEIQVEIGKR